MQIRLSNYIAKQLTTHLNSQVDIGRIDAGLLNHIIINKIEINDQENRELLHIEKLSAKINLWALLQKKVIISTAQLFDFKLAISKKNAHENSNLQFIIDAFSSKDSTSNNPLPDLRINTLLIRRGSLSFEQEDCNVTPNILNSKRLVIKNINANISIKRLSSDSINTKVKQFAFEEQSGLKIERLDFHLLANRNEAKLGNFKLQLPQTQIELDTLFATYNLAAENLLEELKFRGAVKRSQIDLCDLQSINPTLSKFPTPFLVDAKLAGDSQLLTLEELNLATANHEVHLKLKATVHHPWDSTLAKTAIIAQIPQLEIKEVGWELLPFNEKISTMLTRLAHTTYRGEIEARKSSVEMDGTLSTGLGELVTNVYYSSNGHFQAKVSTPRFELGELITKEANLIGHTTLSVVAMGEWNKRQKAIHVNGTVDEINFKNYIYQNIHLDGSYRDGELSGEFSLNDRYGKATIVGYANIAAKSPTFRLQGEISNFTPNKLHLTHQYPETDFSTGVIANFEGNHIDNFYGRIKFHEFKMSGPEINYALDSLVLTAEKLGDQKVISLQSEFIQAYLQGIFNYTETTKALHQKLHHHLPLLVKAPLKKTTIANNFSLNLALNNSEFIQHVLQIPLELKQPFRLNANYHERSNQLRLIAETDLFHYKQAPYRNTTLTVRGNQDSIYLTLETDKLMKNKWVNLKASTSALQNRLNTHLSFTNWQTSGNYSGILDLTTRFSKNEHMGQDIDFQIHPSTLVIADSVWSMHPSNIKLEDNKNLYINNFLLKHADQHIGINGQVSDASKDSILVDLKDINLEYILNLVNFHDVLFDGKITGKAYAKLLKNDFEAEANLQVNDFTFNYGEMGDLTANVKWDKENKSVVLDALTEDKPNNSSTKVTGTITPKQGLDLRIEANRTNLYFINYFTPGIFHDFEGRVSGPVRVYGKFGAIELAANALVNQAKATVTPTNCTYTFAQDSVIIKPDTIQFKNITIYDNEGGPGKEQHKAIVNGELTYNFFKNIKFNFDIQAKNLQGYNQPEFGDDLFCGIAYGTGDVKLEGRPGDVNIDIRITPNANTLFSYNSSTPEMLSGIEFITFNSLNKKAQADTLAPRNTNSENKAASATDLRINFLFDLNPDAAIRVIMDQNTGDDITLRGTGSIRASFYNKGNFQMFGTYRVSSGQYKLSLQEVYRKEFQFKEGGTLTFGGAPYKADLNLQAIHTVNSVSLNDLRAGNIFSQNNVRVNCIMNLGGRAEAPKVTFDFDLPTVSDAEKQMVRSLINTEEEKNLQIIYLLGIGRFYASESDRTSQDQASAAMNSILSSTLSGQLNQVLSNALNTNNNWRLGTHLSTGEEGWSDMDIEGLLSGSLLNNRLLINGNFGYRESRTTTTNFVGDFDIKWLLNKNGNISLKAYNETNERYFTKSSLTTQGAGIVLKRDFDNWLELFRLRTAFTRKERKENQTN